MALLSVQCQYFRDNLVYHRFRISRGETCLSQFKAFTWNVKL